MLNFFTQVDLSHRRRIHTYLLHALPVVNPHHLPISLKTQQQIHARITMVQFPAVYIRVGRPVAGGGHLTTSKHDASAAVTQVYCCGAGLAAGYVEAQCTTLWVIFDLGKKQLRGSLDARDLELTPGCGGWRFFCLSSGPCECIKVFCLHNGGTAIEHVTSATASRIPRG